MIKTLVLPAYNEERYIADIVMRSKPFVDRIIVVDNCSDDKTFEEAKRAGALTVRHCVNLGKAGSLKTGTELALKLGTDIIALMDSDGQHEPEDLPRFFQVLINDGLDIVIGGRRGTGKMPIVRRYGNAMLSRVMRALFDVNVDDIQSGFRVFRSGIYDKIKWSSTGSSHYFADAEITARIGMEKLKHKELNIKIIYHDKYKGMNAMQGLNLLGRLFYWRVVLK